MDIDKRKPYWIIHKGRPVMVHIKRPIWFVASLDNQVERFVEAHDLFKSKENLLDSLKSD